MKRFLKISLFAFVILLIGYFSAKSIRSVQTVQEVTKFQTNHFIIIYQGIHKYEAIEIANTLEANYDRIWREIGDRVNAYDTIKVFIHSNQTGFNIGTGLINSTANGTSRGPREFHFRWTNWFTDLFPNDPRKTALHEFTHCVQLNILLEEELRSTEFVDEASFNTFFEQKFKQSYPQWFWEGISIYEANEVNTLSVKYGMRSKPTLESLNSGNRIYLVGYTLIEFIVETYGKEKLPQLITSYGDIETVLGISLEEFEQGWYTFVDENY